MTEYQKGQETMRAAILERLRKAEEDARNRNMDKALIEEIIEVIKAIEVEL